MLRKKIFIIRKFSTDPNRLKRQALYRIKILLQQPFLSLEFDHRLAIIFAEVPLVLRAPAFKLGHGVELFFQRVTNNAPALQFLVKDTG